MKSIQVTLDKIKYLEFIKDNITHVFNSPWWLDATFGQDWNSVVVESNGVIVGVMPFCLKRRLGLKMISMPILTQKMGPIVCYGYERSNPDKVSYEHKVFQALISGLPDTTCFSQNFDHKITNWLPFFWNNFKQTTRYTYLLSDIKNHESLLKNISFSKRNHIKKAEGKIKINFDLDVINFYQFLKANLKKKGEEVSYTFEQFHKIHEAAYKYNKGRTIYATDEQDEISAIIFLIWDDECAYSLITAMDSKSSANGASSLLYYKAILYCSGFCNKFDFEGSMTKSIEHSFRQYGATQVPYFNIEKSKSYYKVYIAIKRLWRGI